MGVALMGPVDERTTTWPLIETRNSAVLAEFVAYCEAHPDQRFWQALKNWSGYSDIEGVIDGNPLTPIRRIDTFFIEGRRETAMLAETWGLR